MCVCVCVCVCVYSEYHQHRTDIISFFPPQIIGNEEITNVVKILGLQYSKKYADPADLRTLRYGKLMIMTDQDQDGSHIKGLVINFVHHNWPNLIRHNFLEEFITPIVKVGMCVCVHIYACMYVCEPLSMLKSAHNMVKFIVIISLVVGPSCNIPAQVT